MKYHYLYEVTNHLTLYNSCSLYGLSKYNYKFYYNYLHKTYTVHIAIGKFTRLINYNSNYKFHFYDINTLDECLFAINSGTFIVGLTFGPKFNKKLPNIPNTVKHISFGKNFDNNIDNLPDSLLYLSFGYKFNQQITKLPPNLCELILSYRFNNDLSFLHDNIKHLTLGRIYNRPINKLLELD